MIGKQYYYRQLVINAQTGQIEPYFDKKTRAGLLPAGYHMGGGTLTGENHLMDSANKDGEKNRRIIGKDSDRATESVA